MQITVFVTSDADRKAAEVLRGRVVALSDPNSEPVALDVVAVVGGGVGEQELPMSVIQVMALKGADAFPLTVADGHPVKSSSLPEPADLDAWASTGVNEAAALVTEAVSAVDFAGTSRVHISLDIVDIERALPFYMVLFGARPTKRRDDYVKFELAEPSLNLTLNQHDATHASSGHYGVQVKTSRAVDETRTRLAGAGFAITEETETACCYAVQSKIWVVDPDGNRWEVFVVTEAEADEGCGPDCVCYQDLERSFISSTVAATATR